MGAVLCSFARDWALGRHWRGLARAQWRRNSFSLTSVCEVFVWIARKLSEQCVCRSHSNPQRFFPLRSLPAILGQQHTLDPTERTAGSATQLGHSLKEGKCMSRLPIQYLKPAAKDIRDSVARCLAGASRACAQLARGLRAACADFAVSVADC